MTLNLNDKFEQYYINIIFYEKSYEIRNNFKVMKYADIGHVEIENVVIENVVNIRNTINLINKLQSSLDDFMNISSSSLILENKDIILPKIKDELDYLSIIAEDADKKLILPKLELQRNKIRFNPDNLGYIITQYSFMIKQNKNVTYDNNILDYLGYINIKNKIIDYLNLK